MSWKKTVGLSVLLAGSFVLGRASVPRTHGVDTFDPVSATLAASTPSASTRQIVPDLERAPLDSNRSAAQEPTQRLPSAEIREVSICEALSIVSKALRDHPVESGDDSSFCERYRGATLEQFQVARALIRKQYEGERQRIVDERLRDGLYEARSEGEEPLQVRTTDSNNPVAFGIGQVLQGGTLETRTTTIPAEEYPEFQRLQLEWAWLERQARGPDPIDCDR